mmetsp:Transcript_73852/g.130243  ORF Transcript_73852/g.130243 Transcript_73852/m.130243 type:complete len:972 (-) Transcript_73852:1842-4757(-)
MAPYGYLPSSPNHGGFSLPSSPARGGLNSNQANYFACVSPEKEFDDVHGKSNWSSIAFGVVLPPVVMWMVFLNGIPKIDIHTSPPVAKWAGPITIAPSRIIPYIGLAAQRVGSTSDLMEGPLMGDHYFGASLNVPSSRPNVLQPRGPPTVNVPRSARGPYPVLLASSVCALAFAVFVVHRQAKQPRYKAQTADVPMDTVVVDEGEDDPPRREPKREALRRKAIESWRTVRATVREIREKSKAKGKIARREQALLQQLDTIEDEIELGLQDKAALEQDQLPSQSDKKNVVDEGPYATLRGGFDVDKLEAFFSTRRLEVAIRVAEIVRAFLGMWRKWQREEDVPLAERTRGKMLRDGLAGLGPVFLKIGQTLAQRPDIIGDEAADELKLLQSASPPFDSAIAFAIMAQDLNWNGPIAPNVPCPSNADPNGRPLFSYISPEPIASASLGQVYKATLWSGQVVAVKVQRPNVMKQVALDWFCWNRSLKALALVWNHEADLGAIANEVAIGVFNELDYHLEAAHCDEFNRLHTYLGYTKAPTWLPEYSGEPGKSRVLTMEWINGKSFRQLPKERQILMAQMAVECCVTQMLNTGFVHADPHEGNMLFSDEDQLVFLDFGLISRMPPHVMEGFAEGIQYMISGDWHGLAKVFQAVGFLPPGLPQKLLPEGGYVYDTEENFVAALKECICSQEGGQSRFGALATGLATLSDSYQVVTPPYIILLCRTFLTLEGMANTADPTFNIYKASLPYAVRRALSPCTEPGVKALKEAWFTEGGQLQWDRIDELLATGNEEPASSSPEEPATGESQASITMGERGAAAIGSLLGAREGKPMRRLAHDIDTITTVSQVAKHKATYHVAVEQMTGLLCKVLLRHEAKASISTTATWYMSDEGRQIQARQEERKKKVVKVLLRHHLRNLVTGGPRGLGALGLLGLLMMRVVLESVLRVGAIGGKDLVRVLADVTGRLTGRAGRQLQAA